MLPVAHVPCDLGALWRGDIQGIDATLWLPIDCNLVSLLLQRASYQQTVLELSALAGLPQQLLPDLVVMHRRLLLAAFSLVIFVITALLVAAPVLLG